MKAKTYAVTVNGATHFVRALTQAGAIRGLREHLCGSADVELATGEQLYRAGADGQPIIDGEKFVDDVDPAQVPLPIEKESQA